MQIPTLPAVRFASNNTSLSAQLEADLREKLAALPELKNVEMIVNPTKKLVQIVLGTAFSGSKDKLKARKDVVTEKLTEAGAIPDYVTGQGLLYVYGNQLYTIECVADPPGFTSCMGVRHFMAI
jgi:hypothetical protein